MIKLFEVHNKSQLTEVICSWMKLSMILMPSLLMLINKCNAIPIKTPSKCYQDF